MKVDTGKGAVLKVLNSLFALPVDSNTFEGVDLRVPIL